MPSSIKIILLFFVLVLEISILPSFGGFKYLSLFPVTVIFFSLTEKEPWLIFIGLLGVLVLESLTFYPFGFLALALVLTIWFSRASLGSIFTHRSWPSLALFSFLVMLGYNVIILIGDLFFGIRPILLYSLSIKFLISTSVSAVLFFLFLISKNATKPAL